VDFKRSESSDIARVASIKFIDTRWPHSTHSSNRQISVSMEGKRRSGIVWCSKLWLL